MTGWDLLGETLLVVSFGKGLDDLRFLLHHMFHQVRHQCLTDSDIQLPIIHNQYGVSYDLKPFECSVSVLGKEVARRDFLEGESLLDEDDEYDEHLYDADAVMEFISQSIVDHAGVFQGIDWDEAVFEVEREGTATAYQRLSEYYWVVHHDTKKQFHYLKKMAALDSPTGLDSLRQCYENGVGTEKDPVAAEKILNRLRGPRGFEVPF